MKQTLRDSVVDLEWRIASIVLAQFEDESLGADTDASVYGK